MAVLIADFILNNGSKDEVIERVNTILEEV